MLVIFRQVFIKWYMILFIIKYISEGILAMHYNQEYIFLLCTLAKTKYIATYMFHALNL